MGAVFRVPIETAPDARRRASAASPWWRTPVTPLWDVDLPGPPLLLVGAERLGLPEELVASGRRTSPASRRPPARSR